jgi:hypothetical protein
MAGASINEIIDRLPATRSARARILPPAIEHRVEHQVETLPPLASQEERRERQQRACRAIARAVKRGAFSERFATTLMRKMMADPKPEPRMIFLPELPEVTDGASYRRALAVVATAVADGRVSTDEARALTYVLRSTWDAVRAERREQR